MIRINYVLVSVLLLSGCSTFKMVGKFSDYNEVLIGDISAEHFTGSAKITLTAVNSGFSCMGNTRITYAPISLNCSGQRGEGHLICTDGRQLDISFITKNCTSGWGRGIDDSDNHFAFTFGENETEAREKLSQLSEQVAEKPTLPGYNPKETRKEKGFATGTGFFITSDGYLVSNFHVIDGAKDITVIDVIDDNSYTAKVIASDSANDIAILKINASTKGLPLANRFDALKGEEVFTLGYPLVSIQGQEQKATFGRVNALSGIKGDIRYSQVDVPIQPGNSGGPLIDKNGRVIGVVTATLNQINILRHSGTISQNVNFAIKIDYVKPAFESATGEVIKTSPTKGKPKEFTKLIKDAESSIVLVVAK